MPAIEHHFNDFPPQRLYPDTDLLVAYFVRTEKQHQRSRGFIRKLAEHGVTRLYVSSLTWMEFAHVVMRGDFRQKLPTEWQTYFNLSRWEELQVRAQYLEFFIGILEKLLDQFEWTEIALNSAIRIQAMDYLVRYGVGGQDAVHLVTAREAGVLDIASFDRKFERVDGIHLWNDRFYED